MRLRYLSPLIAVILTLSGLLLQAQELPAPERQNGPSGLPLPRFVSLASDEANMRTGPGHQYPILWRYVRPDLPLVVLAEYGNWRRVRDSDGSEGWMHASLLSGKRTGLVSGKLQPLYARPDPAAPVALRAEPGVLVELLSCRADWCRVGIAGRKAWIRRGAFWGTFSDERFD